MMSIGFFFWLLMIVWLAVGIFSAWPLNGPNLRPFGGTLLLFVLLAILGWHVFGAPVHS